MQTLRQSQEQSQRSQTECSKASVDFRAYLMSYGYSQRIADHIIGRIAQSGVSPTFALTLNRKEVQV